jgi:recombination protein RecT
MNIEELEKVRAASKNPQGGAWATWTTEMYRKTVAKRLFKQLPLISTELSELLDRDNEQFDLGKPGGVSSVAQAVQKTVREGNDKAPIEGEVVKDKPKPKKKKVAKKKPQPEPEEQDERVGDEWLEEYEDYVPEATPDEDDDPLG